MDKITKLLKKLSSKEREQVKRTLALLLGDTLETLDIKKLQGVDQVYRVRMGTLRIIFRKERDDIRVLEISRRNEKTYRDV